MPDPIDLLKPMTMAQYARYKGLNYSTVYAKLKRAGMLGLVIPAKADMALEAATPVAHRQSEAPQPPASSSDERTHDPEQSTSYNEAERRLKLAKARQEELKLLKIEGELIARASVIKAQFAVGRQIRDGLMALPARLSGLFAAEHDQAKIYELFTRELHQVLEGLTA